MSVPPRTTTAPTPARAIRADQLHWGPTYPPEKLIRLLTPEQWEELVEDWALALPGVAGLEYHTVHRIGAAGDEGRDVIAYLGDPANSPEWDNYQCKRYVSALRPSDVWLELGKLCYYTYCRSYSPPRRYKFVSTNGVTNPLYKLLSKPAKLKAGLIENWDAACKTGITTREKIPLSEGLLKWIENYDFATVGHLPVKRLLDQFKRSPKFSHYFPATLPSRPITAPPPSAVAPSEVRYVRQLLNAYGHCLACNFVSDAHLSPDGVHRRHFDRSRVHFYEAEALRVFSRATVEAGTFEGLQAEVLDGVIDTHDREHPNGFEKVKVVVQAARGLQINSNALRTVLTGADLAGICHQLANVDKLVWVDNQ